MKKVVIVESPTKTKSIKRYLGDDYEVLSSKGHIRDLATSGKEGLGVDVENNFTPTYKDSKDKKTVIKELKSAVKNAPQVFLASDPDREGEAIAWHLAQTLDLPPEKTSRVVFNEITKTAVQKAFESPRDIDLALVRSQETRRILDRIIGFKLSKLLQSKIKSKSAGRVQSVALKLIVEREKEIKAFIIEEYWSIHAQFLHSGMLVNSDLTKVKGKKPVIANEEEANSIIASCSNDFLVDQIKTSNKSRDPKLPFITSTLQQEASTKLGFSAKKSMMIAQKLYEGVKIDNDLVGLITYMRTDSTRLSNDFVASAQEYINDTYGKEYLGKYRIKKDKAAQDAHEGVRPTNINYTAEYVKKFLSNDEYKLYKLIYARAVASLMAPSKSESASVIFKNNNNEFTARGSILKFDGYLKLYGDYEQTKDELLPVFIEGNVYNAEKIEGKQHFTEPPARYSEARLIKAMEELGIGRPSTYSTIIDMIQKRAYVTLDKSTETSKTKVFFPTDKGILTDTELAKFFESVINVEYTANMEKQLDEIAEDKEDNIKVLREFYDGFQPLVDNAYQNMDKIELEKTGELCPDCGGELVIREGRYGKFISCANFPKCKYTQNLNNEKKEKEQPILLEETCPECGSNLVKRKSRYGKYFIGCSAFPKCRYIQKEEKKAKDNG